MPNFIGACLPRKAYDNPNAHPTYPKDEHKGDCIVITAHIPQCIEIKPHIPRCIEIIGIAGSCDSEPVGPILKLLFLDDIKEDTFELCTYRVVISNSSMFSGGVLHIYCGAYQGSTELLTTDTFNWTLPSHNPNEDTADIKAWYEYEDGSKSEVTTFRLFVKEEIGLVYITKTTNSYKNYFSWVEGHYILEYGDGAVEVISNRGRGKHEYIENRRYRYVIRYREDSKLELHEALRFLHKFVQFGNCEFEVLYKTFNQVDLSNSDLNSVRPPYLLKTQHLEHFFEKAIGVKSNCIDGWDVEHIKGWSSCFQESDIKDASNILTKIPSGSNCSSMFLNCTSLTAVGDVCNVTNAYQMFNACTSLNQDFSSWDVSSVLIMKKMFAACTSLNQDFSSWDVSSVTRHSLFVTTEVPIYGMDASCQGSEECSEANPPPCCFDMLPHWN